MPYIKVPYSERGRYNRLSMDVLRKHASEKGGKVLTDDYSGINAQYEFQCRDGHVWKARAQNVLLKDNWCPTCGKQFYGEHSLKTFQTLAANKGGICLSTSYDGIRSKLTFMCVVGHIWSPVPANVLHRQSWCYFCARTKSTRPGTTNSGVVISQIDNFAALRGGRLLTREYRGSEVPFVFECGAKHQWLARLSDIKKGNWCKKCAHEGDACKRGSPLGLSL